VAKKRGDPALMQAVYNMRGGKPQYPPDTHPHNNFSHPNSSQESGSRKMFERGPEYKDHTRLDRESDLSMKANEGLSENREEEEDSSGGSDQNAEETMQVSNSLFYSRGGWFVAFESRGSSDQPQRARRLIISPVVKRVFFDKKITALAKFPGDNYGNMALWMGGPKEMIGLLKNDSPIKSLEIEEDSEYSKSYTNHICYLNSYLIFFTINHNLIVMDLSGNIVFISRIDAVFSKGDYVISSLSHSETGCLILGSNDGRLVVLELDFQGKGLFQGYSTEMSTRRITSLLWVDEESKQFLCTTLDKVCCLMSFQKRDEIVLLRTFFYDHSVSCCVSLGPLVLAAFGSGTISIIETEKGEILTSMRLSRIKSKTADHPYINWLGYIYMGNTSEYEAAIHRDYKGDETAFQEFVSRLRIICKYDDNTVVLMGYPNDPQCTTEINFFEKRSVSSANESRRLPLVLERFSDDTLTLRMFNISAEGSEEGYQRQQDVSEVTWMAEVDISLKEDPPGGPKDHRYY